MDEGSIRKNPGLFHNIARFFSGRRRVTEEELHELMEASQEEEEEGGQDRRAEAEHDAALVKLDCVHLGPGGCQVYNERPLICRLFGTTPRLACPNGCGPEQPISPRIEQQIFAFFSETRQVLV